VRVTQIVIPQPIAGEAFASQYALAHGLGETPRFVVSNVGPTTLESSEYEWGYVLRGTTPGADAGFGSSGTGRLGTFEPGTSYTAEISNTVLAAGDYSVVACAWAVREMPDGGATSLALTQSFDPLHCVETSFTVSP
jgi:hypothetical protein